MNTLPNTRLCERVAIILASLVFFVSVGIAVSWFNSDFIPDSSAATAISDGISETIEIQDDVAYEIITLADTNKVLDVEDGYTINSQPIQIYTRNNTQAQKWRIVKQLDDTYAIYSVSSGKVIDVEGGATENGAKVQQYEWNGSDAQKWEIQENSDGSVTFVNAATGLVLDVIDGKSTDGTDLQTYSSNGSKQQKWVIRECDAFNGGLIEFASTTNNDKVLDIVSGSTAHDATLQLYPSNDTLAQRWKAQKNDDGFTEDEANYAISNCGADWNEQARLRALEYASYGYSHDEIGSLLVEESLFTNEQAEYGVSAAGV